jgi:hypothetical protein
MKRPKRSLYSPQGLNIMKKPNASHKAFCRSLTADERLLLMIRDDLYHGSWKETLQTLKHHLKQKPRITRLRDRIRADIARILKMQDVENKHQINLADFLSENR